MSNASTLRRSIASCLALVWLAVASPAGAEEDPTNVRDVSVGFASGLCTLIYTPVKITYAATGAVITGLVYIFSAGSSEAAGQVLRITAGGDYVIAPEHLRGTRVLRFTGV